MSYRDGAQGSTGDPYGDITEGEGQPRRGGFGGFVSDDEEEEDEEEEEEDEEEDQYQ